MNSGAPCVAVTVVAAVETVDVNVVEIVSVTMMLG